VSPPAADSGELSGGNAPVAEAGALSTADSTADVTGELLARYRSVRAWTQALCAPLAAEDYAVQSMPDASPAKWHLAHTSWFFETFVLQARVSGYTPFHPKFGLLFNSYYEALGPRHPRPERGMLTRPSVDEIYAYRRHVDSAFLEWLAGVQITDELRYILELGLAHEQQHQELLLTDLQHMLSRNPLAPAYTRAPAALNAQSRDSQLTAAGYEQFPGGLSQIGHAGAEFAFDNERPRHRVVTEPYQLARRLVTAGEYVDFMRDGGYARPELWLSDGWRFIQDEAVRMPLYWEEHDGTYARFSLYGTVPVDLAEPVCHVSFYEADAYARWAGARLPTEAEWELAYAHRPIAGQFVEHGMLLPVHASGSTGTSPFGSAWVWTASPYVAYPGFAPEPGALGEYNGKFMCNQMVLRGGSCFTPQSHLRATYRNFFPPTARWQVTGLRLAK
jgi:ergothioneine biosynthesis protein EgtB